MIKIFTSKTQSLGEKGEEHAVAFLKKQGFSIVDRNVANKYGEIDIVAKKGSAYYFFEVKAGYESGAVHPIENFHETKLRKVRISVEHYCLVNGVKDYQIQGILVLFGAKDEVRVEMLEF